MAFLTSWVSSVFGIGNTTSPASQVPAIKTLTVPKAEDARYQIWEDALGRKLPNQELISHVEYWFKKIHGDEFEDWVTLHVIVQLIRASEIGTEAEVAAPARSGTYDELSAEELISLLGILNSHLKDGNHSLTPQNGAVAKALVDNLKKYIIETLPNQNKEKAIEVYNLISPSSDGLLKSLALPLRMAILSGQRQNGVSIDIAWIDAIDAKPEYANRELLSHIDYWFREINNGVWPEWLNETVRWQLVEASKIGTVEQAKSMERHATFSLLSAEELLVLYRLFQSHLEHGDHSLTPQNGQVAKALLENLQDYILYALPKEDQAKAETICRFALRAPPSFSLEKLANSLMERLQLFKGPFGTVFNRDFFRALNIYQASTFTSQSFSQKYWPVPTERLRRSYEGFLKRVNDKKTELEKTGQSPSSLTPIIPKKIHLIWIGNEVPQDVLDVKKSWEDEHPGWEVKLWTNEESEALIKEMRQKYPQVGKTWDKAVRVTKDGVTKPIYAERADVLRICILYKEGGVYVDSDLPNFGKVDDFHYFSDFYISLEVNDNPNSFITSNALIGSRPEHPLLLRALNMLRERKTNEGEYEIIGRTGPGLFADQIYYGLINGAWYMKMPPLVLPPSYFFPLPVAKREVLRGNPAAVHDYVTPWTAGVHLWNFSWSSEGKQLNW